jgi:hypothetical protein
MKDLNHFELMTIEGGQMINIPQIFSVGATLIKKGISLIVGGLVFELITEGIQECIKDFEEGFNSTYKGN